MDTPTRIRQLLTDSLQATIVEIEDESDRHAGHAGRQDPLSSGGHYRIRVASPLFLGKGMVQQHRLIYAALAAEMGSRIHALSIQILPADPRID